MKRESVNKFDLEAAFKALNEVEIPVVKGIRPSRENLQEKFTKKLVTDVLVEDYFDINDSAELEQAQEEREAEIAKAKLARIEKIVDLEAETEEDLLPSYVGKLIMQCPQCMTLFYKNEEDIEKSEENPEIVNLNEPCQHCGNSSGYTLIGKVGNVGKDEAENYDVEDFEDHELNLDFEEEPAEEPEETEESEEVAAEEGEDLELEPVEETEEESSEEEEEVKESLTLQEDIEENEEEEIDEEPVEEVEEILTSVEEVKEVAEEAAEAVLEASEEETLEDIKEVTDEVVEDHFEISEESTEETEEEIIEEPLTEAVAKTYFYVVCKMHDKVIAHGIQEVDPATLAGTETAEERAMTDFFDTTGIAYGDEYVDEDDEFDWDNLIRYVGEIPNGEEDKYKGLSEAEAEQLVANSGLDFIGEGCKGKNCENKKVVEEPLTEAIDKDLDDKLKAHNDYIEYLKRMIEQEEKALSRADNEYVKKAIQRRIDAFKADLEEALPEALKNEVETDLPTPEEADLEATENKDDSKKETKESLTEDLDAERKLDAEEAALENSNAEDYVIEGVDTSTVVDALDELEVELTEDTKATYNVSDAEFRAMLKNPVFKEACKSCKEDLAEDLPPVSATPFEKAAEKIENAGSELTPEEQKLEDEELAAKEGVEESLTESADLFADDGTLAILIYPDRLSPEARKEKLLADPDFVKALEAFAQNYKMVAKPEDLEDGVTLIDDMYDCAFEGIEGKDLKEVLDELISYYVDIKADAKLTEAAPQGDFVSKLKRNYSTTELIVKELKGHPMFSGLSTRTIQRILLPYYIENMGRAELSAQSIIDFFTEEGFAPYVLDHFFQIDPLARKELLKADAKFMEIFNAFAKKFKMFPTAADEKAPGESDFDFAFSAAFDMDENGVAQDNEINRETIKAFGRWYVNGEFDEKLVENFWEAVEDFDEKDFNKLTENYLINVYSNVKAFEATGCELVDNKLVVEGIITFNSGKTKSTTFVYEATEVAENRVILEGLNADFATEKAFILNCNIDKANCLIVESLNYKYTINNTLVEGLIK